MKADREHAAATWFKLENARKHAEASRKRNALRRLVTLTFACARAEALYCRLTAAEREVA